MKIIALINKIPSKTYSKILGATSGVSLSTCKYKKWSTNWAKTTIMYSSNIGIHRVDSAWLAPIIKPKRMDASGEKNILTNGFFKNRVINFIDNTFHL